MDSKVFGRGRAGYKKGAFFWFKLGNLGPLDVSAGLLFSEKGIEGKWQNHLTHLLVLESNTFAYN